MKSKLALKKELKSEGVNTVILCLEWYEKRISKFREIIPFKKAKKSFEKPCKAKRSSYSSFMRRSSCIYRYEKICPIRAPFTPQLLNGHNKKGAQIRYEISDTSLFIRTDLPLLPLFYHCQQIFADFEFKNVIISFSC
jgi:hypothetical protein